MSLYKTKDGEVSHEDAVKHVDSVPSRRRAELAYSRIERNLVAADIFDAVQSDMRLLRDFIWSR